jgi:hypothetical protein
MTIDPRQRSPGANPIERGMILMGLILLVGIQAVPARPRCRQGQAFWRNGTRLDGFDSIRRVLLEAKDGREGYAFQLEKWAESQDFPSKWAKWARDQVEAADGIPVEVHFSNKDVAEMVAGAIQRAGLKGITVIPTTAITVLK